MWSRRHAPVFRRGKYAAFFHRLDTDGDGRLDLTDGGVCARFLAEQLELAPQSPRRADLVEAEARFRGALRACMDTDGDGRVGLYEFSGFFLQLAHRLRAGEPWPPRALALVDATFALMDGDGDGAIDPQEYAAWLALLGAELDPAAAFAELDLDRAGRLGREAFGALYRQWLLSDDPRDPGNHLLGS
jgi:hypothetical protein